MIADGRAVLSRLADLHLPHTLLAENLRELSSLDTRTPELAFAFSAHVDGGIAVRPIEIDRPSAPRVFPLPFARSLENPHKRERLASLAIPLDNNDPDFVALCDAVVLLELWDLFAHLRHLVYWFGDHDAEGLASPPMDLSEIVPELYFVERPSRPSDNELSDKVPVHVLQSEMFRHELRF